MERSVEGQPYKCDAPFTAHSSNGNSWSFPSPFCNNNDDDVVSVACRTGASEKSMFHQRADTLDSSPSVRSLLSDKSNRMSSTIFNRKE
ncbi:hypothetical protein NPIL_564181 [Nephila pilipes]|uniref:Uncharacterized protein n=1 Tax=Nephila pilipes TaxID=299642 RepID=A0A8X6PQB8_NEPPI|nr:hypothetical protein NPIL_564181 [Nephila pilipes]